MTDHISQFESAMREVGIEPPEHLVADGKLHRFPTNGRQSDDSGFYVLHGDGVPAGHFGDWRTGISQDWRADTDREFTPEEKREYAKRRKAIQEQRAAEDRNRKAEARQKAAQKWENAQPEIGAHRYLLKKGVGAYGLKSDGYNLLVPMRDERGALHSIQTISPDGAKKFLPGGRVKGCYYPIGKPNGRLCIAEGFATAASIYKATGHAVAVAFNSGNLLPVAETLRKKLPDIELILCADDDSRTKGNPGITSATEAAQSVGGTVAVPDFGNNRPEGATDFNDLHKHAGIDAVKASIAAAKPVANAIAQDSRESLSVRLVQGHTIVPEPIQWLWDGWLAAGKMHILAGVPGTGKTTISLALAATITTGGRWPDGSRASKGDVLIWSGEDDPQDTLIPRLHACGADLSRVHFVSDIHQEGDSRPFDPAYDVPHLRKQLEAMKTPIKLMIVDPIVSATSGDSHKNAETRRSLQPLVDLAQSIRCAMIGITHFTKGTAGRDPLDRVTGSLAFGALARLVMVAAKNPEDGKRVFMRAKSNIGEDHGGFHYDLHQMELDKFPGVSTSQLLWGEAIDGTARELLAETETTDDSEHKSAMEEAMNFLTDLLDDGPVLSNEIKKDVEQAGLSWATVKRAKKSLGIEAHKDGMNGKWSWSLPPKGLKNPEESHTNSMSHFGENEPLREESEKF
ncbi:MAG: AAA family ATPase [Candidatus Thiodiazotropha sp. (ex. Lucinisca nassula)]|nr:AAA family ATPase [Candidatus Thiodiazotropha sp. (ex. Lucinisca nassula)]MBW9273589.1 AAA family ATPase [Candidatus Thiodiazotropha sp. (ex. Lucinisca nassula)]